MPRSKYKMWRNGPGGRWTTKITWYQGESPDNIRLELEDCNGEQQVFPQTREEADHIWFQFKQGSPQNGENVAFVDDLLNLLGRVYPHLTSKTTS